MSGMASEMTKTSETNDMDTVGYPGKEKVYSLRRLNSMDVFLMVKILGKIKINEWIPCLQSPRVIGLINQLIKNEEPNDNEELDEEKVKSEATSGAQISNEGFIAGIGVAMEVVDILLQHLPECRQEIFQLLSNVSGIGVKEVEELDAEIFIEMLVDFIKKEEFKGFIKAAARLVS